MYSGERLFLVTPLFFGGADSSPRYQDSFRVFRDVTLTLEELQKVQNIRCELKHDGPLPPGGTP